MYEHLGTHSYDRIAELLSQIHIQYNLQHSNLLATITDNASNFPKAFKIFGIEKENENYSSSSDDELEEMNIDFDTVDVNILPMHIRCFAHTLSLYVTTEVTRTFNTTRVKYNSSSHN